MQSTKRIYLSEYAVSLFTARWLMTSASQLMSGGKTSSEQQEIIDNTHIYIISKLPSISFCPDSFQHKNGLISGKLIYKVKGELHEIDFSTDFQLSEEATEIKVSSYPHRELITYNSKGEEIRFLPASMISTELGLHIKNGNLGNLEVLYVGQAFGDGSRNAFDRLRSHSTCQKILAQAQYEDPDSEVYVLAFEYCPYRIFMQFDGKAKGVISDYRDLDRVRSVINNPLTIHQQICLAEASLIRYFKPKYNEIYKKNFPKESHKILESCYDLDFSGLVVEIDTEELRFKLFSETVPPSEHHICKIEIIDPEERWGFFHMTLDDNKTVKDTNVIEKT